MLIYSLSILPLLNFLVNKKAPFSGAYR